MKKKKKLKNPKHITITPPNKSHRFPFSLRQWNSRERKIAKKKKEKKNKFRFNSPVPDFEVSLSLSLSKDGGFTLFLTSKEKKKKISPWKCPVEDPTTLSLASRQKSNSKQRQHTTSRLSQVTRKTTN
jgi:hypothetical protein